MPSPPTVIALKEEFLSTQTRLLTQPLAPSRAWQDANDDRAGNDEEEEDARGVRFPEKAVDDALFRLNNRLRRHASRVYPLQATKHIAEQIDQLYWNATDAAVDASKGGDDEDGDEREDVLTGLYLGADLVDPKTIATLPPTWPFTTATTTLSNEAQATLYSELVPTLQSLSARKTELSARVSRLRRFQSLLEPFSPPAPPPTTNDKTAPKQPQLQDNLVTRNGEIEKELQRMRMLLARVGGRVDQLQPQQKRKRDGEGGEDENVMDLDVDSMQRRKIDQLLRLF